MFRTFRRKLLKMFREFLVYHHGSLEFRAKILTLMVAVDGKLSECEEKKLREIACQIYEEDKERAELLVDTVKEYLNKIVTKNGLDFEDLVQLVEKETKEVKRFSSKINVELFESFQECLENEEDKLFQQRVLEFLARLKEEYGEH